MLAYQGLNVLANANLILQKTARLVLCRGFTLTSSPTFFECRSVRSPETLVSNGLYFSVHALPFDAIDRLRSVSVVSFLYCMY